MTRLQTRWPIFILLLLGLALGGCSQSADELIVYSARKDHLVRPVFERYTALTGIQIRHVTDKAGVLLQRLEAEGDSSPADVLITVDAGNLWQAAERGLLQPMNSEAIRSRIPESLRDPGDRWTGLTIRARTIVYSTERVEPSELQSYEALAEPKWKGRLCLRTSKKVYNQSLTAMMIEAVGIAETESVIRGWVGNLATDPHSSDTQVLEAIAAGQCDVGIVNTYYFGRLLRDNPELPLALFWPNQGDEPAGMDGVHVNISGAGVTRHSRNRDAARQFIEWMTDAEAQRLLADANLEYPANPDVEAADAVSDWGAFRAASPNLATAGERQAEAVKLMDRAGYR